MIKKTIKSSRRPSARPARPAAPASRTIRSSVMAGTSITAAAKNRAASRARQSIMANYRGLNPQQVAFCKQIEANCRSSARNAGGIFAATNPANIAAKPEIMSLLPLFVQKLLVLDVFGSVALKSRQQMIPYFKVTAENTKGETAANTILNSPMVNRQGLDPNFAGQIVKNEVITTATGSFTTGSLAYLPVLPNTVTVTYTLSGTATALTDDGAGTLLTGAGASAGTIDYSTGTITLGSSISLSAGDSVKATYEYDNTTVGPNAQGKYGAQMGKTQLILDEFNMVAEAHELASYWSGYAAFAAQQEYGANLNDLAKEAAFGEIIAEINTDCFNELKRYASFVPAWNWDAAPVSNGSVVPHDYLNMFKLTLGKAASSVYQRTNLSRPNKLIVGSIVAEYIKMLDGFKGDRTDDTVGPYKLGTIDGQFDVYVNTQYDPIEWVMCCKSTDIRRNSALFGEYMPLTETAPIVLADQTVQQGYATMYAKKVVNPDTIVGGKIIGTF